MDTPNEVFEKSVNQICLSCNITIDLTNQTYMLVRQTLSHILPCSHIEPYLHNPYCHGVNNYVKLLISQLLDWQRLKLFVLLHDAMRKNKPHQVESYNNYLFIYYFTGEINHMKIQNVLIHLYVFNKISGCLSKILIEQNLSHKKMIRQVESKYSCKRLCSFFHQLNDNSNLLKNNYFINNILAFL